MESVHYLFCDASYDAKLGLGVGAFLKLSSEDFLNLTDPTQLPTESLIIESDGINRIEIQTVIYALESIKQAMILPTIQERPIILYTDCKMIEGLPARKEKLESNGYLSRRSGKQHKNSDLYQKFYRLLQDIQLEIKWLKGHSPSKTRDQFQKIFAHVDQQSRKTLRKIRNDRESKEMNRTNSL